MASPAPPANPETQAYWAAAKEGRFLLKECRACGEAHYYPRAICPFCSSADTEWIEASGRGVIYTFSVMKRADGPYVLAYVQTDEGPRLMTNIVDCRPEDIWIDQAVSVVFKADGDGIVAPMFTPAVATGA